MRGLDTLRAATTTEGLVLSRARVPSCLLAASETFPVPDSDGLVTVDIAVRGGAIERISPSGPAATAGSIDLDQSQVWPAFADLHTHLDKGHIIPRAINPDGTLLGAVMSVAADRSTHWSADDVRRRFEFGLRCAYAHGTSAIRTHLDCEPPQATVTWPVFSELRSAWAGRIALQGVGKYPLELYSKAEGEEFAALVAKHRGILGAVTRIPGMSPGQSGPFIAAALDTLFKLAAKHALDVDLHVDESGDPEAATLGLVAEAVLRNRFKGRVVCGHCCSLAVQRDEVAFKVMDLCAEAGLAVVTLPMINLYLQDRGRGTTPRWRGITLVHELARRGVQVAVASDNCRDPFFAFGDLDMLEVFRESARIAHLDLPYGDWPASATRVPASLMGIGDAGVIRPGSPADLVVFRARAMSELLARPQSDRVVLRGGVAIDTTLPDYRELGLIAS